MRSRKTFIVLGVTVFMCLSVMAAPDRIVVKGSDTLVRLGRVWARAFMDLNEKVAIRVSGGGSGRGIEALLDGSADICEASRDLTEEEYAQADRSGIELLRIPVALDGIVVFVHKDNPVDRLDFDQLRGIFTGEIINWKDLGGSFEAITIYGRENVSGTYSYFKHTVLRQEDYSEDILVLPTTAAIVEAVAKDENGIGYGGLTWAADVKYLAISRAESFPAVLPTSETVAAGIYPISRELYWFVKDPPSEAIRNMVNWVLTEDAQEIAASLGYVPLSEEVARRHRID